MIGDIDMTVEEPFVLVARHEGRTVATLPLRVHRPFGLPLRRLMSSGEFVVAAGYEARVREAIAEHLARRSSAWDLVDLPDLPGSSPLIDTPSSLRLRVRAAVCRRHPTYKYVRPRYQLIMGHRGVRSRLAFVLERAQATLHHRLSVRVRQFSHAWRRIMNSLPRAAG